MEEHITLDDCIKQFIKTKPISIIQQDYALYKAYEHNILNDLINKIMNELKDGNNMCIKEIAGESLVNISTKTYVQILFVNIVIPEFSILVREGKDRSYCFEYMLDCIINLSMNSEACKIIVENRHVIDSIFMLLENDKICKLKVVRVISRLLVYKENIAEMIIDKDIIHLFKNMSKCIVVEYRIDSLIALAIITKISKGDILLMDIIPLLCKKIFMDILLIEKNITAQILINAFQNGNNQVSELIKKNTQKKLQREKRLSYTMAELMKLVLK